MKKYILTSLMILASVGCFAKMPNMQHLQHKVHTLDNGMVTFDHKSNFIMKKCGKLNKIELQGYDSITKCTYQVKGIFKNDTDEPHCTIVDNKNNTYESYDYWITEVDGGIGYHFYFLEDGIFSRVCLLDFESVYTAWLQTFEKPI